MPVKWGLHLATALAKAIACRIFHFYLWQRSIKSAHRVEVQHGAAAEEVCMEPDNRGRGQGAGPQLTGADEIGIGNIHGEQTQLGNTMSLTSFTQR